LGGREEGRDNRETRERGGFEGAREGGARGLVYRG
jgi:hypothetical protein